MCLYPRGELVMEHTVCMDLGQVCLQSYSPSTRLPQLAWVKTFQERDPPVESPKGPSVCPDEALSCGQS